MSKRTKQIPYIPLLVAFVALLSSRALGAAEIRSPQGAVWTKSFGTLRVERFGTADRAVILVPGLASGAWAWRDAIEGLKGSYSVYAVTLAGFDGVAPVDGPHLDRAVADLAHLIETEHIDGAVIAGHSLGGHIALRVAGEHPTLVSGVLVVDALPQYPPAPAGQTPEARKQMVDRILGMLRAASDEQYAAYERSSSRMMVSDPAAADRVASLVLRSDRTTVVECAEEMMLKNLTPELGAIRVPVVVVVPIPAPAADLPEQFRSLSPDEMKARILPTYEAAYRGVPNVLLVPVLGARHFAMIDQPKAVLQALEALLARTPASAKTHRR